MKREAFIAFILLLIGFVSVNAQHGEGRGGREDPNDSRLQQRTTSAAPRVGPLASPPAPEPPPPNKVISTVDRSPAMGPAVPIIEAVGRAIVSKVIQEGIGDTVKGANSNIATDEQEKQFLKNIQREQAEFNAEIERKRETQRRENSGNRDNAAGGGGGADRDNSPSSGDRTERGGKNN